MKSNGRNREALHQSSLSRGLQVESLDKGRRRFWIHRRGDVDPEQLALGQFLGQGGVVAQMMVSAVGVEQSSPRSAGFDARAPRAVCGALLGADLAPTGLQDARLDSTTRPSPAQGNRSEVDVPKAIGLLHFADPVSPVRRRCLDRWLVLAR